MGEPTVSVAEGLLYALLFVLCGSATFLAGNFYYQIRKIEVLKYLSYLALSATIDYGFRTIAIVLAYLSTSNGVTYLRLVARIIASVGQLSSFVGWCLIGFFMLGWFTKEKKQIEKKAGP